MLRFLKQSFAALRFRYQGLNQRVYLTDLVVGRMLDGGYDTLLFLDKSARPVAWLF